ncbi:Hypothetical predicted protein [Octopus vulgaris]|uniref:Uncharacterized protein n=1 Tax=Octopus vulgaris TaxID=6645 RepID=A0AA36AV71_OCTVU|nr:Hypothetical predicted protein [Octopus vulgaris]
MEVVNWEKKTRNAASTSSRTRSDEAYRQAEQERDTEARNAKRQNIEVRDSKQQRNTSARRSRRLNLAVRDVEQEENTTERRSSRLTPAVRDAEQDNNTAARRSSVLQFDLPNKPYETRARLRVTHGNCKSKMMSYKIFPSRIVKSMK